MAYENDTYRELQADLDRADQIRRELKYDKDTKTLGAPSPFDDPDRTIRVSPQDLGHFATG